MDPKRGAALKASKPRDRQRNPGQEGQSPIPLTYTSAPSYGLSHTSFASYTSATQSPLVALAQPGTRSFGRGGRGDEMARSHPTGYSTSRNSDASSPGPVPAMTSVPTGFHHLLNSPLSPPPSRHPRLSLFIRQQPAAARACGGGDKGRRPIDPVPIVQLLIKDFSPSSETDRACLAYKQYVVGCQLFAISRSEDGSERRTHYSSILEQGFDRHGPRPTEVDATSDSRSVQVLSGKTWVSPFYVEADPEPSRAPAHPRSTSTPSQFPAAGLDQTPSTFFVFTDLCVRTAGVYRLRFRLFDVGGATHHASMPAIDEAWSRVFQVYAAKDFPGMSPTPYLAEQLKRLGVTDIKTRKRRTVGDDDGDDGDYD